MSWYLRSLADADTHRRDYSIVTRSVDTGATGRVIGVNFSPTFRPSAKANDAVGCFVSALCRRSVVS